MKYATPLDYLTMRIEFGELVIVWRHADRKVLRIYLPQQYSLFEGSHYGTAVRAKTQARVISVLCRGIRDLLAGKVHTFDLRVLDWSTMPAFQRRVLHVESRIPRGMTSTYGRIARKLGVPDAARAVGSALAHNPFPVIIPCHRVIKADRSLGGYAGGLPMKRRLLELEGVNFDKYGRVLADRFW
jgi:methylated-DNA-[protein]-cysteine S-methyltransferase